MFGGKKNRKKKNNKPHRAEADTTQNKGGDGDGSRVASPLSANRRAGRGGRRGAGSVFILDESVGGNESLTPV